MKLTSEYNFDFRMPGKILWNTAESNAISSAPGETVRYSINDNSIGSEFSTILEPVLADALEIAIAAHMADRLALRQAFSPGGRMPCARHFKILMPVRELDLWRDERVMAQLTGILGFLSQDCWEFQFEKCSGGNLSSQQHLFGRYIPTDTNVALFSGGLDSFAGTAIAFDENPQQHFICVSASPSNIQKSLQRRQFNYLCRRFDRLGSHISVQYSMKRGTDLMQEPSRRTRAFVFLIIGASVALTLESSTLHVYENGIGAINLPYDLSQIGIDNTRAMHPRTLREIAQLISRISQRRFSIKNCSFFATKAEMCRHSAVSTAREGIESTFSCDRITHTGEHCGYCTSCFLRRLALYASSLSSFDHKKYLIDCLSADWHPKRHHLRGLSAMTWQATRLKFALAEPVPWVSLVREFPELQAIAAELALEISGQVTRDRLLRIYQHHTEEWLGFPAVNLLTAKAAA